jgi:phospholipase B1
MAMGDSLTAGLNSRVVNRQNLGLIPSSNSSTEFRGGSWLMGGDPDSTSVGNILSFYNPSLSGLSKGNCSFLYCYGPICPAGRRFPYEPASMGLNAAQSGSWTTLYNTFNQLKYLDKYYKAFVPKSMKNPWKLLFLQFGFNNICSGCLQLTQSLEFSVQHFDYHIRSLLEEIRARYSKIFITMVGPFNISEVIFQRNT